MTTIPTAEHLLLTATTAAELMSPNPVSIRAEATIGEATAFLIDRNFGAAPVIDEAGRPVGVLSRGDIVVHERERADYIPAVPDYFESSDLTEPMSDSSTDRTTTLALDEARVRDVMTPVIFSVTPDTSTERVIENMLAMKVHRLFVIGDDGVLLGVISALDVLRHLQPASGPC
jgi:CBS domain-containing protein